MAPEYLAYGQLTEKADVYSFGVVVLEIVAGRRNNEGDTSDHRESLLNSVSSIHFLTAPQLNQRLSNMRSS